MGKQAFLCAVVVLVGGNEPAARGDDQPVPHGTKVAEPPAGLLEALKDKDPAVRLQAAQLLVRMGEAKAALPVVEELLKAPQQAIRLEASLLLKQMEPARLAAQLKHPDPSARLEAAQALWRLGSAEAKAAVPVLVELLKSPRSELRFRAALMLTQRSIPEAQAAVDVLVQALKDRQAGVRLQAAQRLQQMDAPEFRAAAAVLVDLLRHPQPEFGFQPAMLLGQMPRGELRVAVPALREALNDPNPNIRFQAALILVRLGRAETQAALPVLIDLLKAAVNLPRQQGPSFAAPLREQAGTSLHLQVAQALAKIGPEAKAAIPPLVKLLDNTQTATLAALALRQIGPEAVPPILETWSTQASFNRPGVIQALALFGPRAKPATPKLIQALTSADAPVRELAAKAFGQIGTEAVPALARALGEPDPRLRQSVAAILGEIGPAADNAIPALSRALRAPEVPVRIQAALALWEVQHSADSVIPVLLAGLKENDLLLRRSSARVLAEIDPVPEEILPALRAALKDQDLIVRLNAAVSLCGVHTLLTRPRGLLPAQQVNGQPEQVREAVSVLVTALQNKALRAWALVALAKAGPEAKEAIPALLSQLQDEKTDDAFAGRIGSAVAQIAGPQSAEILLRALAGAPKRLRPRIVTALGQSGRAGSVSLLQLVDDEDAAVRARAVRSLGQAGRRTAATVPLLAKALQDRTAQVRREAIGAVGQIGREGNSVASAPRVLSVLTEILQGEQAEERILAAEALACVEPRSQRALAALVERVQAGDRGLRRQAIAALGRIAEAQGRSADGKGLAAAHLLVFEKAVLPALAHAIDSSDASLRLEAALALAQLAAAETRCAERQASNNLPFALGPPLCERGLSVLLDVVRERNHPLRSRAMEALLCFGAGGEAVVEALTRALADDGAARIKAAEILGQMGPLAGSAVPALGDLLKGPDSEARIQAALALWRIGHQAEVVPILVRELKSTGAREPMSAALLPGRSATLATVSPVPPCRQAADALAQIGPAARAAVPALTRLLSDSCFATCRPYYALALARIDRQAAGVAVPVLSDLLAGPRAAVDGEPAASTLRQRAARALGQIGPPARDAMPSLRKALLDQDEAVRSAAAEALKRMGG